MRRFLARSLLILICHGLMVAVPAFSATCTEEIKGASDQLKQLMKMGNYEDALSAAETLVRLSREYFGVDDPRTAEALKDYADVCENLGKTDEAERAMREALRITEKAFGKESQRTAAELNDLGEFYKRLGRYNESEPLLKRALEIHEKLLGLDMSRRLFASITSGNFTRQPATTPKPSHC
jgi:tetratricopeptide (TPR) repeat protein